MADPNSSKYSPLARYLRAQSADSVRMKFSDIERVIGAKLPRSADTHRAYWSNNASNNVMTRAWLAAGFRSEQVDLAGRKLVFRRAERREAMQAGGFSEAPSAPSSVDGSSGEQPSLFGCMAGTVVINCDLTEPADPGLADYLDVVYGPAA